MYQAECSGYYVESLLNLIVKFSELGIASSWTFLYNESIIARGRNKLATEVLDTDATHLLFIDADMRFNPDDIIRMIQADVDVIAAVCPKKEINWANVKSSLGSDENELERKTGFFNFVPLDSGEFEIKQYEPLEVQRAGTGIMLIKRQVFEQLKPFVKTFLSDKGNFVSEYFKMEIDDNGIFIGEDYYFCELYKKHGGKIFAAPWTQIGHHGPYLFQGTLF